MIVKNIELLNFRGYEKLSLKLEPNINVLVGKNGAGKTNLAEAISYLSIARSFRTNDEKELRMRNKSFSKIQGLFEIGTRKAKVEIILTQKGKQITINGSKINSLSELLNECHVLVFKPGDAFLFDDSPSERRKLVNLEISRQSKKYLFSIRKYEKLLQERNTILKEENVDLLQLDVITRMLIETSREIIKYRINFFQKINPLVRRIANTLTKGQKEYEFKYEPFVKYDETNFEECALKAFEKAKESDLRYRLTTIGVHREDFSCALNGAEIKASGSQGEKRLAALILKLSIYELVKDEEKKPILILDDVFSELDEGVQNELLKFIRNYSQVIITTTEWNKNETAAIYDVVNHVVTRRVTYGR